MKVCESNYPENPPKTRKTAKLFFFDAILKNKKARCLKTTCFFILNLAKENYGVGLVFALVFIPVLVPVFVPRFVPVFVPVLVPVFVPVFVPVLVFIGVTVAIGVDKLAIFVMFVFGLFAFVLPLLAAGSQAIPKAPTAKTAERAITFFIFSKSPVFLKLLFLSTAVPRHNRVPSKNLLEHWTI
ncbi:MAG TPA: hypothetical protein VK892_11940 [Pyrinomonadaceae bacterium]|nr:hypothetical protein [Pyrinomonadaceae bacterium]